MFFLCYRRSSPTSTSATASCRRLRIGQGARGGRPKRPGL